MPGKKSRRNHVLTVIGINGVGEENLMTLALSPSVGLHRVRVRTPGKHIVAFCAAALVMIAGAIHVARMLGAESASESAAASSPARSSLSPVALDDFLVDLAPNSAGRVAYARLSVAVHASTDAAAALKARETEARERITFLLRGVSADDLVGEEGLTLLKDELRRRINLVIAPAEAEEVAITDLIVQ